MAAIFVLPVTAAGQRGPVAALTSTAGWAAAAERVLGTCWIITPDGLIDPEGARRNGTAANLRSEPDGSWAGLVPLPAKTLAKDLRRWRQARQFTVAPAGPWSSHRVEFVWQRHDLFHRAGAELARDLGVPLVLFVPATVVWEAHQWGVERPGWGRALEAIAERPTLAAADLVACGSDAVAEQAERIGASPDRILVTPTGVDLDLFERAAGGHSVRQRHGLDATFVVGWAGSFRRFHAIEQVVEAAARVPGTTLLLVGDGPERPRLERLTRDLGVGAVFTGTVAHHELPEHLAAMDAAVVVAGPGASFHYSPLKLAEYMAAGLAVVGPDVGALAERLHDDVDALLVAPGDVGALTSALLRLRDDRVLRKRLGAAARAAAAERWSWDLQVRRVIAALDHR